jgi:hypothetical protein
MDKTGGRREERLLSGRKSTSWLFGSSSSPESSSDEGDAGRRAGGSLSPRAMVRVGGGGNLWKPTVFLSVFGEGATVSVGEKSGTASCGRMGRRGGACGSSTCAIALRRTGNGGGDRVDLTEESLECRGEGCFRGGGRGGGIIAECDDCGSGAEFWLASPSLEVRLEHLEWVTVLPEGGSCR